MSVDIELEDGFKYHYKGDEVDAKFIRIAPYSMKQMEKVAPIQEIVNHALANMSDGMDADTKQDLADKQEDAPKKEEVEAIDGSMFITWVSMYGNEGDLKKLYAYFKVFLISGVCYIDGEEKLTGTYIESLTPSDFKKVAGEYYGNFMNS